MNTKKNLLDLEYNKNLQYYTTTIIIMFTYFIAAGIAIIARQIDYKNRIALIILMVTSIITLSICTSFLNTFKNKMGNIREEIASLNA